MRRDQSRAVECRRGSGLPDPSNGDLSISRRSLPILSAVFRSFSTHQQRSSNACGLNSKASINLFRRNTLFRSQGRVDSAPHRRIVEVSDRLEFLDDFVPSTDRHDDRGGRPPRIGDSLDIQKVSHAFILRPALPFPSTGASGVPRGVLTFAARGIRRGRRGGR